MKNSTLKTFDYLKRNVMSRYIIGFKKRIEQRKVAIDSVRMPFLGFKSYNVYPVIENSVDVASSIQYGQYSVSNGIKAGTIFNIGPGYYPNIKVTYPPMHETKWLKPKHVTLLRIKGHKVELANNA